MCVCRIAVVLLSIMASKRGMCLFRCGGAFLSRRVGNTRRRKSVEVEETTERGEKLLLAVTMRWLDVSQLAKERKEYFFFIFFVASGLRSQSK